MTQVMDSFRANGVPKNVPLMVTESHISWRLTGSMSQIFAALWLADNVGSFFAAGGAEFHHSPIQPERVNHSCQGSATWSNFVADADLNVKGYTSPYFAARLLNLEWLQHGAGVHHMFPASTDIKDAAGNVLVTSYAMRRPDGNWSLMLVNRDQVEFSRSARRIRRCGTQARWLFSRQSHNGYIWQRTVRLAGRWRQ